MVKNNFIRTTLVIIFFLTSVCAQTKKVSLKEESFETLTVLVNSLLKMQIVDEADENYGRLICPESNIFHTRAAEAVYPFKVIFKHTSNEKYLPGGVAYSLTHEIDDNSIIKKIKLRYHDRYPLIKIIEPIVQEKGMKFFMDGKNRVVIKGGKKEFVFEIQNGDGELVLGKDEEKYWCPFPAVKCYPIELIILPPLNPFEGENFLEEISYKISIIN